MRRSNPVRRYTSTMTVALLKEPPLSPDSDLGPYRRQDYEALPDEPRCELIYGRFYLSPSPSRLHQAVLFHLSRILDDIAMATGGYVYVAPLDVNLAGSFGGPAGCLLCLGSPAGDPARARRGGTRPGGRGPLSGDGPPGPGTEALPLRRVRCPRVLDRGPPGAPDRIPGQRGGTVRGRGAGRSGIPFPRPAGNPSRHPRVLEGSREASGALGSADAGIFLYNRSHKLSPGHLRRPHDGIHRRRNQRRAPRRRADPPSRGERRPR